MYRIILKVMIVMSLFMATAQARVYSPLHKSGSNSKIIDIGVRNQIDVEDTTPKVWDTYLANYDLIEGIVYSRDRIDSLREGCVIDEYYHINCPMGTKTCDTNVAFSDSTTNEIAGSIDVSATCIKGTSYNISSERCEEIAKICSEGQLDEANNRCIYTPPHNTYGLSNRSSPSAAGWGGILSPYNISVGDRTFYYYAYASGVYTVKTQADNHCQLWTDDTNRGTTSNWRAIYSYSVSIGVGQHKIRMKGWNDSGPYGMAATITDPSGRVIWNSRTGQQPICNSGWNLDGHLCEKPTECINSSLSRVGDICYAPTICPENMNKVSETKCQQKYTYNEYVCPEDINKFGEKTVSVMSNDDCFGLCEEGREENCTCNTVSKTCPVGTTFNEAKDRCEYIRAEGGTKTITTNSTFIVPENIDSVNVCMCGGGSGGKSDNNSKAYGGRSGEIISDSFQIIPGESIPIIIGSGGNGGYGGGGARSAGKNGSSTEFGSYASAAGGVYDGRYCANRGSRTTCGGTFLNGGKFHDGCGGEAGAFGNGGNLNGDGQPGGICAGGGGNDGSGSAGVGGVGQVKVIWPMENCPDFAPHPDGAVCFASPICPIDTEEVSETQCSKALITAKQNCRILSYECPLDESIICTKKDSTSIMKKPLESHLVEGDGLVSGLFGEYIETSLGVNSNNGINKIYGTPDRLCFTKVSGITECAKPLGCSFSGLIESENSNISAIWTEDKKIKVMDSNGVELSGEITSTCLLNGTVGYKGRKENIPSFIIEEESIKFWNPYFEEGYLGQIGFIRNVNGTDEQEGYKVIKTEPYELREEGFLHVESYDNATYAISKDGMNSIQCSEMASKYGYQVMPGFLGIPIADRYIFDLVMNTSGGYFNDNSLVLTKKILASCEIGILDEASGMCHAEKDFSTGDKITTVCTDEKGIINYATSGNELIFNHTNGNGKGCPYIITDAGSYNMGGKIKSINSIKFDYKTSGNGCYDRSETGVNAGTLTTYCPSGGTQWPELQLSAIGNVSIEMEPTCPSNSYGKEGLYCIVPLAFGTNSKCVLQKPAVRDFYQSIYAFKNVEDGDGSFFCSNLTCDNSLTCQTASCPIDLDGTVISPERDAPAPSACLDDICDANLPYYQWCGKEGGCPENQKVYQELNGECYKTVCSEGGLDATTGLCYKWQCPDNYTENEDGSCVK